MRWKINFTDHWSDVLRFALRTVFVLNIFMLAVFSVWFTAIFLARLGQYLMRTWFGHPW
jgi:hypothetical protein